MRRIGVFLITNLAVLVTLSAAAHLLGVDRFITAQGMNFTGLLGFAVVFGFGGAFISLFMSKWTARMAVGAQGIETPRTATERWLLDTVRRQAERAGIGMPEVAVYEAEDINAFATGWNRNAALVAVSTGLLQQMSADEAEAVLGHEVAHIANGDMVTLTLIQGVLNTFVIVIARLVGWFIECPVWLRTSCS